MLIFQHKLSSVNIPTSMVTQILIAYLFMYSMVLALTYRALYYRATALSLLAQVITKSTKQKWAICSFELSGTLNDRISEQVKRREGRIDLIHVRLHRKINMPTATTDWLNITCQLLLSRAESRCRQSAQIAVDALCRYLSLLHLNSAHCTTAGYSISPLCLLRWGGCCWAGWRPYHTPLLFCQRQICLITHKD